MGGTEGQSIIGSYGPWAAGLAKDPPDLSFRSDQRKDLKSWRGKAMTKARELVAAPDVGETPSVKVHSRSTHDGLEVEQLSWQLPYGRRTRAILLKPAGAKVPLPGILGLHDHGGNKYFGRRKITRTLKEMHPMMQDHQKDYYEDRAWANELARRGYVVLVHDAFAFASRRVMFEDMKEIPWGGSATRGLSDKDPENESSIKAYNAWAAEHEHIMAKSLFCSGTTWPGVFLGEDRAALNVLSDREDVNPGRLGCAGLSGGGLRTVFLGGLDHRIRCAIAVGFMSTWNDFLLYKSYTHTWMTYVPLLPKFLDFPEILGLRVPLPTMTLNNNQDGLFTLSEMKKASGILQEVFDKAGVSERYKGGFYEGPHKFDKEMQEDAFDWFDQWLS
jgi:dienelactone hydrolase